MKQIFGKLSDRLYFVFLMFFITAGLMLFVTVVISVYINRMERAVEESIQNHLLIASQAASTYLSVEELDLFHTDEDMERPEWDSIRSRLMQFAEQYRVLYVYYWRYNDGQIQYIIDNDEDEEWMVTPELYFYVDEDEATAEAVPLIMAGEQWASDLGTYTTSWDNLISGVSPVFNADGTVYAAAGVDLSDEIIITQRNNIRVMRTILVFAFVLSVMSGFMGMWLYRKKAAQSDSANKAKSQFLSTMSHEIRTPMNAIIGIAQIELQKSSLPKEYAGPFEKIFNSGNGLLGIINDILDLSKIETGKLELIPVEYGVPELINDAIQVNMIRIGSKPIDLKLDIDEKLPSRLIGDELRLKQILNNLLSNAIKYTKQGHVKLSASHSMQGEAVVLSFSVEDSGQGMKPQDLEKLFSEYVRFNLEDNVKTEGTGIGLNITRNLVQMMDGTIKADSVYGKGSVFTVTVKQKAVDCQPIGAELVKQLVSFTFTDKREHKNLQVIHESMPYGKVLIVDDVETNLYVAEGLMSPYDLQIETAISGFIAVEKVESGISYDVIFMDHLMPVMDGIETTQKLRNMGYNGVIVALTANALDGNAEMFMQKGFDDFISKPIDIRNLDAVLNKFVRDKHSTGKSSDAKAQKADAQPQQHAINSKVKEAFCRDAEKAIASLKEIKVETDQKKFITTVHAMKSALAYINEHEKSEAAFALEQAGVAGDTSFINANTGTFIASLEELLKKLCPINPADAEQQQKEDTEFLIKQLEFIKYACEDFDDTAAYSSLDILKEIPWDTDTLAALDEIRNSLYSYSDFDAAGKIIKKLIEIKKKP